MRSNGIGRGIAVLLALFSLHTLACVRDTGNDPLKRPRGPLMILNKTKPTFELAEDIVLEVLGCQCRP